ncbi:MAG: hypothetical protein D6732_21800, partial [Methanobacteriota archaeon]
APQNDGTFARHPERSEGSCLKKEILQPDGPQNDGLEIVILSSEGAKDLFPEGDSFPKGLLRSGRYAPSE